MGSASGHWRNFGQAVGQAELVDVYQVVAPDEAEAGQAEAGQAEQIGTVARAVAVTAYLTAALLSFLPPLLIYLLSRRSSVTRAHAAQAANVAITTAIYALCSAIVGGLLTFDSPRLGVATAAVGVTAFWLIALANLIPAAAAASRGRIHQLPPAFCAPLLGHRGQKSFIR